MSSSLTRPSHQWLGPLLQMRCQDTEWVVFHQYPKLAVQCSATGCWSPSVQHPKCQTFLFSEESPEHRKHTPWPWEPRESWKENDSNIPEPVGLGVSQLSHFFVCVCWAGSLFRQNPGAWMSSCLLSWHLPLFYAMDLGQVWDTKCCCLTAEMSPTYFFSWHCHLPKLHSFLTMYFNVLSFDVSDCVWVCAGQVGCGLGHSHFQR